jgi:hypothetical protein
MVNAYYLEAASVNFLKLVFSSFRQKKLQNIYKNIIKEDAINFDKSVARRYVISFFNTIYRSNSD